MTDHEIYKERLSALLDGELDEAARAETLAHLDECEACRAYFAELAALHEALSDAEDVAVPEGFAAGVMARLHETADEKPKKKPVWRKWTALAACAAVVLLAVTVVPELLPRMGGAAPADSAAPAAPMALAPAAGQAAAEEDMAEDTLETEMYLTTAREPSAPASVEGKSVTGDSGLVAACTEGPMESDSPAEYNAEDPLSQAPDGVLLLHGEDAGRWLREHGVWDENTHAYWVPLDALLSLPDGLSVGNTETLEQRSEQGLVILPVREAETEEAR